MSIFRTLHQSFLILFAVVVIAIVTLVHFSIAKIVAEQSRAQQQSISPALSLIVEQLMKPLHVSQTLAKAKELKDLMAAGVMDETVIFDSLKRLEKEFGMSFFIASETSRRQYNSDGTSLDLIEGQVNWYFKYKDADTDAVADIGKWEDTHFYIDLKIYDENNKFLGFFGVGKSLRIFLSLFDQFKQKYGYDFIFVDQHKNITLSSDPELIAANSKFHNLTDLSWYQALSEEVRSKNSLNNLLVRQNGQDYLIAEVSIAPFDWTLYLMSPLQARQTQISRTFIFSVVSLLVVIFGLFILIYNLLYYFKRDIQKSGDTDHLTKLANRRKIEQVYNELMEKQMSLGLILLDIDNFKAVNDTHGHNAGDQVLRQISTMLQRELREQDVLGRWGGEEFVILLPETGPHEAMNIAQHLRERMATMTISTGSASIQVTGSFGVTFTATPRSLTEVISSADDALYHAKRDGRNMTRLQLIETL